MIISKLLVASITIASALLCGDAFAQATPLRYVALGSSFASGPGLPAATGEPDANACGRSSVNYAHLLAQRRHLALTDVSCGGATTANLLQSGQFGAPAQLTAVTAETRLVTVTIGGNDVFYMRTLGGLACQKQPLAPGEKPAPYCKPATVEEVDTAFGSLAEHLHAVAEAVHEKAPQARLIFVGYLSTLPAEGTCDKLQLTPVEATRVRSIADRLNAMTAEAAHAEHADFLNASTLSQGHDACALTPWTNGFVLPDAMGKFTAIPFHPNAAGMAAVADALDELLSAN